MATTSGNALDWKVQGPYEVASDGRRLCVRETLGSEVLGTIVGVVLMGGLAFGGWRMLLWAGLGWKIVGVVLILLAAFMLAVALRQVLGAIGLIHAPTRIPLVVFDRGDGSVPAGIEFAGRRLAVSDVRCLSTRPSTYGGRHTPIRHIIVAELHDGAESIIGLDNRPDWTAHYAQQGAQWLGLPYRPSPR